MERADHTMPLDLTIRGDVLTEASDAELVRAAQEGDKAAFAALYRRYLPRIHRYFYARTGDVQRAEDLTAQTFAAALEALHRYRERGYFPGSWWAKRYFDGATYPNQLMVPMDSRTTASPRSQYTYVFYRQGGWSWSIPYIAGLYALAAQMYPDITPELFWASALSTADMIEVERGGRLYTLGSIVKPDALITVLERR